MIPDHMVAAFMDMGSIPIECIYSMYTTMWRIATGQIVRSLSPDLRQLYMISCAHQRGDV